MLRTPSELRMQLDYGRLAIARGAMPVLSHFVVVSRRLTRTMF